LFGAHASILHKFTFFIVNILLLGLPSPVVQICDAYCCFQFRLETGDVALRYRFQQSLLFNGHGFSNVESLSRWAVLSPGMLLALLPVWRFSRTRKRVFHLIFVAFCSSCCFILCFHFIQRFRVCASIVARLSNQLCALSRGFTAIHVVIAQKFPVAGFSCFFLHQLCGLIVSISSLVAVFACYLIALLATDLVCCCNCWFAWLILFLGAVERLSIFNYSFCKLLSTVAVALFRLFSRAESCWVYLNLAEVSDNTVVYRSSCWQLCMLFAAFTCWADAHLLSSFAYSCCNAHMASFSRQSRLSTNDRLLHSRLSRSHPAHSACAD